MFEILYNVLLMTLDTRWVFKNKLDESGQVIKNKVRLVAQEYNQEEGIDFDELMHQ